MENYLSEVRVIENNGIGQTKAVIFMVPAATEIHHTRKPKATYLNDERTWLAVCREMHEKIEQNKSWARERGYLQNI